MNPLHQKWIQQILPGPLPTESRADCLHCPLCAVQDPGPQGLPPIAFLPLTKCCTHFPILPNFLVGGILEDSEGRTPGAQELQRFIQDDRCLSPKALWIGRAFPEASQYLMKHPEAFGRDPALICPLLDANTGLCTIWSFRNSICASYFCRYDHGRFGKRFWEKLRDLLLRAEREMALQCMDRMGLEPSPGEASQPEHWGSWADRKEAFYRTCWREAQTLTWNDLLARGDLELRELSQEVPKLYASLQQQEIPSNVRVQAFQGRDVDEQHSIVWAYNPFDPVIIPRKLAHFLDSFTHKELPPEAKKILREALSLLPMEFRRELYLQGILVVDPS